MPLFHIVTWYARNAQDQDVSARCLKLVLDKSVEMNIDIKRKIDYQSDYEILQNPELIFPKGPVLFPKEYVSETSQETLYEMVLRTSEDQFEDPPSLSFLELWKDFGIELMPWTFNKLSKASIIKLVVEIYQKISFKNNKGKTLSPGGEIDRLLGYPKACSTGRLYKNRIQHLGKGILMKVIVEYLKIKSGDKVCQKRPSDERSLPKRLSKKRRKNDF